MKPLNASSSMQKHASPKNTRPDKNQQGFTLIELMIVVVIIALLATFILPNILDRPGEARVQKAKLDLRAIETALNLYKLDNFRYPTTEEGLEILVTNPKRAYLDKLPTDPWGETYLYLSPGATKAFDLMTFGADKREGGEGEEADISLWTIK
jgi:general secretion pathway protein G